jgi:lysophospholipase L1-like esterase
MAVGRAGGGAGNAIKAILGNGENIKCAAIGDSFVRLMLGGYTSNDSMYLLDYGLGLTWTQAIMGFPLIHNVRSNYGNLDSYAGKIGHNLGKSSDSVAQVVARLSDATALQNVKYWIVSCGTNSLNVASPDLAQIKLDFQTIIDTLLALGGVVELNTVTPRRAGGWTAGAAAEAACREFNKWMKFTYYPSLVAAGKPVILLDNYFQCTGANLRDDCDNAFIISDTVHPSAKGAFVMGMGRALALAPYIPIDLTRHWIQEQFNASTAPNGNMLTDAEFSGTSGTNGTGSSGTPPTGWTASRGSGSTITVAWAAASAPDGGADAWTRATVTANGTGVAPEGIRLRSAIISTGAIAAEYYIAQVQALINEPSVADLLMGVEIWVNNNTATNRDAICLRKTDNAWPNATQELLLLTPAAQANANDDDYYCDIWIYLDGTKTGNVVIDLGRPNLRRLESAPDYT